MRFYELYEKFNYRNVHYCRKLELVFKAYIHKHICRRKYFKGINTNILTLLAHDEKILFSSFHLSVFPRFYILM